MTRIISPKKISRKEQNKKYYEENKEKILKQQKEYYQRNKQNISEKNKEYRKKNKEKKRETNKKYREKNREKLIKISKEYYHKNKKVFSEKAKEYREKNKEKIKEDKKRYYEENYHTIKEKMRENKEKRLNTHTGWIKRIIENAKRYDKNKNFYIEEKFIDVEYIEELLIKQKGRCYYSDKELISAKNADTYCRLSIDRIDSSKGHIKENCRLVSHYMNISKGNKTEEQFKEFLKRETQVKRTDNWENTERGWIIYCINSCRKHDRMNGFSINMDFITYEYIISLLERQKGFCPYTLNKLKCMKNCPKYERLSIDRIDNSKGHIIGNCRLVCHYINIKKGRKSHLEFCEYLRKYYPIKIIKKEDGVCFRRVFN